MSVRSFFSSDTTFYHLSIISTDVYDILIVGGVTIIWKWFFTDIVVATNGISYPQLKSAQIYCFVFANISAYEFSVLDINVYMYTI